MPSLASISGSLVTRVAVVALLVLIMMLAFHFSGSVNATTESGVLMELPSNVGSFSGRATEISEGEKFVLPKDTEIVKMVYTNAVGDVLNAQIVLAGAEKRSIHRPELCLPAQGWSINGRETVPVKMVDGRTISYMKDTISRNVDVGHGVTKPLSSLYCYWFVGNGATTPSHLMRLLMTSWDRVVHHKNHRWAYVAVSAPVLEGFKVNGKNPEATQKMIDDFIAEMGPVVMRRTGEGGGQDSDVGGLKK
jgi:hypothetical protein